MISVISIEYIHVYNVRSIFHYYIIIIYTIDYVLLFFGRPLCFFLLVSTCWFSLFLRINIRNTCCFGLFLRINIRSTCRPGLNGTDPLFFTFVGGINIRSTCIKLTIGRCSGRAFRIFSFC